MGNNTGATSGARTLTIQQHTSSCSFFLWFSICEKYSKGKTRLFIVALMVKLRIVRLWVQNNIFGGYWWRKQRTCRKQMTCHMSKQYLGALSLSRLYRIKNGIFQILISHFRISVLSGALWRQNYVNFLKFVPFWQFCSFFLYSMCL